jgi:ribose transport system ATP-binding protein
VNRACHVDRQHASDALFIAAPSSSASPPRSSCGARTAGSGFRAVGSDATLAHRLGAHVALTRCAAYVLCAFFAFLGGLLLAAQIGIGDPSAGGSYSLTSIAAVVLGGASIYGGRGSFIGALLGALLIQESATSTAFLGFGLEWQYWLPEALILVSACVYSSARRERAASLGIA